MLEHRRTNCSNCGHRNGVAELSHGIALRNRETEAFGESHHPLALHGGEDLHVTIHSVGIPVPPVIYARVPSSAAKCETNFSFTVGLPDVAHVHCQRYGFGKFEGFSLFSVFIFVEPHHEGSWPVLGEIEVGSPYDLSVKGVSKILS